MGLKKYILTYLCFLFLFSSPQTFFFWGPVAIQKDGKYVKPTPEEIEQIKYFEKLIQNHNDTHLNTLPLDQEQQGCNNLIGFKKKITPNIKLYLKAKYNIDALRWLDLIVQKSQSTIEQLARETPQQARLFSNYWKDHKAPFKNPAYQKAFKEACRKHTENLKEIA